MKKKIKNVAVKTGKHSLHLSGLLVLVALFLSLIFVWRVSTRPYDITFLKSYIEMAMRDKATGHYAKMGHAVLYWPNLKGPLYLQLHDSQLFDKDGLVILSVDQVDISFSRSGLLMGKIMPKSIILKKPALRVSRSEQGNISVNIGNVDASNKNEQLELTTRVFGYIARPGYENIHDSLIAKLQAFIIEDAQLLIDDAVAKQTWSLPHFDLKMVSTRKGMKGTVNLELPSQMGIEKPKLEINMNYIWDKKDVSVSADLKSINLNDIISKIPSLNIPNQQNIVIDAHIEAILDETFSPSEIIINVISDAGSVNHPELSDNPLIYKDLSLNAAYSYAARTFHITDTKVTLNDITVFVDAGLNHTFDTAEGFVNLNIDEVKQENIASIWPKFLEGENAHKWIVKKMSDGVFKDVKAKLEFAALKIANSLDQDPKWFFGVSNIVADFKAEDMTLDYRSPLDKARHIYGNGHFDYAQDSLSIKVKKAKIGNIQVHNSTMFFDRLIEEGVGDADLHIHLNGDIADIMQYISKEPISFGNEIAMDISKVRGNADLSVRLIFPARASVNIKDFKINISGKLKDVLFPDVVETLDLSGGPLDFVIKDGKVSMKGNPMLDNRPITFSWEAFLDSRGKPYKEKIVAKITADPNIRAQLGIDLSDFIEGSIIADIVYILYRNGSAKADVKIDATPALFFVDPFDYKKISGEKASVSLIAHFKNKYIQKITNLEATGKDFSVSGAEITFIHKGDKTLLDSGKFPKFRLLETNGKIDFKFDKQRYVDLNIDTNFFDAQPFMDANNDKREYNSPPMRIKVIAQKMRTAPSEIINNVSIYMDIDNKGRFNQMEMDARVGASDMFVRFNEGKDGKRTFRLKTEDAGGLLKAFQIHNNIRGGVMVIYGEPIRGVNDRNLRGKAEIRDFKVMKAPALTKLLSVISLTGIGDALSNHGLMFKKMEVDFSWLFRKNGSLLVLKNGRTSGNSLGILFDGTFDNEKRYVDISGTIAPMAGLNKIIGKIPLLGDILTGGSGGVFAATYSIKGSSDDPVISANPLSVITPGILRRILWE